MKSALPIIDVGVPLGKDHAGIHQDLIGTPNPRIPTVDAWLSSLVIHLAVANVLGLLLLPLYRGNRGSVTLELAAVEDTSEATSLTFELQSIEINAPVAEDPRLELDTPLPMPEWQVSGAPAALSGSAGTNTHHHSGLQANYFGVSVSGDRFVYVLDMSTSMNERTGASTRSTRFQDALGELIKSVDALTPQQCFYVYLFCYETRRIFDDRDAIPQMIPATTENKLRLREWLSTIQCGTGTDPRTSLYYALRMRPNAIFLLSDGKFNGNSNGRKCAPLAGNPSAIDIVKDINRGDCPIHALSLAGNENKSTMTALANVTGGSYRLIAETPDKRNRRQRDAASLLRTVQRLEESGQLDVAIQRYGLIAENYESTPAAAEAMLRLQHLQSQLGTE